jgi:hypothetical protein
MVSVGCPSSGGQRTVCGARAGSHRGTRACLPRRSHRQGTQALASAQRVVHQARRLTGRSSGHPTAGGVCALCTRWWRRWLPLTSNVKRLPSVMNQGHSVNRCEAGCGSSQGLRAGHRRAVHQGQRGLPVLRRPAHGVRCASRFASGHTSVFAAPGAAARNTGVGLGAARGLSSTPPNHSVKRTAPGVPGSAAYLKR